MKKLFDTTKIKNLELGNRFIKAAVWEALATEDGHMTPELFDIYRELAEGGIGTILTGYAYVNKDEHPNPNMMGIYDDTFIDAYKDLTQMVHKNDSNIIMQMVYGGSMTHLNPPSENIWSPSGVKDEMSGISPVAMTLADIKTLVSQFAQAAKRAELSGFDGVEVHAAHGYLLSQFLSPHFNRRTDAYGGSLENRARIITEIIEKIRTTVNKNFLILVKINSQDFIEKGLSSKESIEISKRLEACGVDAIEVSGGNESTLSVVENNLGPARKVYGSKSNESYFSEHALKLAEELSIPVILTGGNRHFDVMDQILKNSKIEYFGLARPMISEPDLIKRWEEDNTKPPKCVSCNKCYHTYGKRCILRQGKNDK